MCTVLCTELTNRKQQLLRLSNAWVGHQNYFLSSHHHFFLPINRFQKDFFCVCSPCVVGMESYKKIEIYLDMSSVNIDRVSSQTSAEMR